MEKRDELLLLMAMSGEIPADWIGFAVDSESYGAALLTKLKKDGFIKLRNKDGLRGYLLREKAKRYLLETYPDDAHFYLTGTSATNYVKSEPEKRLRLHRMSMVWIYLFRVGVLVRISEKCGMHPVSHPIPLSEKEDIRKPYRISYYCSAEWKQETDREISGSRSCGILIGESVYVVYNTMDRLMKWTVKVERNLRGRLEFRMRRNLQKELMGAILFGQDMMVLQKLLESDGGIKGNLFQVDEVYDAYYYIPFLVEANVQLRLLCDQGSAKRFREFLHGMLREVSSSTYQLEEGFDQTGTPVYFCYLLEMHHLIRIKERHFREPCRIICFSYQAEMLKNYFGEAFQIDAMKPERAINYLGWEEETYGGSLQNRK